MRAIQIEINKVLWYDKHIYAQQKNKKNKCYEINWIISSKKSTMISTQKKQ